MWPMPQLHVYVSPEVADAAHRAAKEAGLSVSRYLAVVLARQLTAGWPEGYFETVVGSWRGDALERPDQGKLEERERLDRAQVER